MKTDLEYLVANLRTLCNTLAMEDRRVFAQNVKDAADRLEKLDEANEPKEGSVRIRFVASVSPSGEKHVVEVDENTPDDIVIQRSTFSGSTHRCFGFIDVLPVVRMPIVHASVESPKD
jgi:hypothetical protein